MPSGIVHHQHDDLLVVRVGVSSEFAQRLAHQLRLDAGQEHMEQASGLRLCEPINVQPLVFHLPVALRPHTAQRPHPPTGRLQTHPRFIFGPHLDRLTRVFLTEAPHAPLQGFFSTPVVRSARPCADDSAAALEW